MRIVKMLKFPDDSYRLLVQGVGSRKIVLQTHLAVPARNLTFEIIRQLLLGFEPLERG